MIKTSEQEFSLLVFGRRHHLAIVGYIASLEQDATFTQAELEQAASVRNASSIQTSVAALVRVGFIRSTPNRGDEREQPFTRSGSGLWLFTGELLRRLAAFEASEGASVGVEADEPVQPPLFSA